MYILSLLLNFEQQIKGITEMENYQKKRFNATLPTKLKRELIMENIQIITDEYVIIVKAEIDGEHYMMCSQTVPYKDQMHLDPGSRSNKEWEQSLDQHRRAGCTFTVYKYTDKEKGEKGETWGFFSEKLYEQWKEDVNSPRMREIPREEFLANYKK